MKSSPTLSQKLTAEVIGTAILVFIGAGSVPLTVFLTGKNPFSSAAAHKLPASKIVSPSGNGTRPQIWLQATA